MIKRKRLSPKYACNLSKISMCPGSDCAQVRRKRDPLSLKDMACLPPACRNEGNLPQGCGVRGGEVRPLYKIRSHPPRDFFSSRG